MNNNLRDHDVKEKMKEDNFRLFKFRVDGSSKVIKTKALKSLTLPFPAGWSRQFFFKSSGSVESFGYGEVPSPSVG